MTFAWPWAWLGLLSLPVLASIYWLRQRAPRREVSSLLLWSEQAESRARGRRFERFEAHRLFWLELLILTLLVTAAAGPEWTARRADRPLVVVLDDSFSMLAGGERSPLAAAREALLRELEEGAHGSLTLVLAGDRPQILDEGASPGGPAPVADAAARLERWRARSAVARLDAALALAFELKDPRARVLVLSDRAPPSPPGEGRLAWWSFGEARPNLALVSATRGAGDGEAQTCRVEVASFSSSAAVARVSVTVGDGPELEPQILELAPGALGRLRFSVPSHLPAHVRVTTAGSFDDGLALDDSAVLLPEGERSVRVALEVEDAASRRLIADALQATRRVEMTEESPELLISDGDREAGAPPGAWILGLVGGPAATPYVGPFVLDHQHPLSSGLSLEGVIWGARSLAEDSNELGAVAVVTAGDVVLLAEHRAAQGLRRLSLNWSPQLSTLQRTPAWPILWLNLVDWRARSAPGVRRASWRLGSWVEIALQPGSESAELELPGGERRRLQALGEELRLRAEEVGIHRLHHGSRTDRWAVNALSADESDLRQAVTGRWGTWQSAEARWERRSWAWLPLLLALAGSWLHLRWIRQSEGGER